MRGARVFPLLAAALALALVLLASGCGGGDEDASGNGGQGTGESTAVESGDEPGSAQSQPVSGSSPRFKATLVGLKTAAAAGSTYGAEKRAKSLPPAEKAVVDAFCYFAWQIGINREAAKLEKGEYVVGRITTNAEFNLNAPAEIEAAMDGLQRIIDLESLEAKEVARYTAACKR